MKEGENPATPQQTVYLIFVGKIGRTRGGKGIPSRHYGNVQGYILDWEIIHVSIFASGAKQRQRVAWM